MEIRLIKASQKERIHKDLPILALSIRQPWAWAILHAGKDIENRAWFTNYAGPICIHAAKKSRKDEYAEAFSLIERTSGLIPPLVSDIHRGGIVGTAYIQCCVLRSKSPWFYGTYGFVLSDVRPVDFVPVRGALGLFRWREKL